MINKTGNLNPVQTVDPATSAHRARSARESNNAPQGNPFAATLEQFATAPAVAGKMPQVPAYQPPSVVKFSSHAIDRMLARGIQMDRVDLQRLSDAVEKARGKGSKDSLVLMDDKALIVSVKNNTVVTVMDKEALKENVFTNIDSTIVI